MQKYKLTISYDGTNYCGWQIQLLQLSIQAIIHKALETTLREKISLTGSGRTDAGVHALGQTAHFSTEQNISKRKLHYSLNGLLPKDIRIINVEAVPSSFHARYSVKSKVYHYHTTLAHVQSPFSRLYTHHIHRAIDISLMKKAAIHFIGTHNFTSFANEASKGSAAKNPIKTIKRLDIIEEEEKIRFEFEGDGFLYKMVRNITGTLIEVGTKKIPLADIPSIIKAKNRQKAGTTAPAQGLFLVKVNY